MLKCDVPFEGPLSLSGVEGIDGPLNDSRRELGNALEAESIENARFGVLGWPPCGVPGIGAGAARTLNSDRKSRVSSFVQMNKIRN